MPDADDPHPSSSPSPPSRRGPPAGVDVAVDPAHVGDRAARRRRGADRGDVGRRCSGPWQVNARVDDRRAAIPQSDARLRPASGGASSRRRDRGRRADGGRRPERRRQVDAVQGHRRRRSSRSPAASSAAALARAATSPTCRRPPRSTARSRSMSTTWWRWGCGAAPACSAASAARRATRIEQAIAAVGLTGFEDRAIGTLSGGQMQRMLFARLLLQDARVIVLDEPFNAVDAKTSADLFDLVRRWHGEQRTVLTALHDIDFVRGEFPGDAAARARAGGLGHARPTVLTAGEPAHRAAHVRGLRRACAGVRGAAAGGAARM